MEGANSEKVGSTSGPNASLFMCEEWGPKISKAMHSDQGNVSTCNVNKKHVTSAESSVAAVWPYFLSNTF